MKGSEIFNSLMKKEGVEIDAQDSIRLANFLTGMINAHGYVRKERDDSERSRTELIKQNSALAAENERLEAELARLPAKWSEDSSLKTWFPLTSEMYERALLENESLRAVIKAAQEQVPYAYASLNGEHFTHNESHTKAFPGHGWVSLYADPVPAQSPAARMTNARLHGCALDGWQCFHCGEVFETVGGARNHFGATPDKEPGCIIKVKYGDERGLEMELRKVEAERDSLQYSISNESTEADLRVQSMQTDHQIALRREEEKGYARGLDDGRNLLPEPEVAVPGKMTYRADDYPKEERTQMHGYINGFNDCIDAMLNRPAGAVPDGWNSAAYKSMSENVEYWKSRAIESENLLEKIRFDMSPTHMGEPLIIPASPHDRCPSHEPQSAPVRSPQDYAIEHAEYMAVNGEQLLSYLNSIGDEDEGVLVPDDRFSDYISGLESGIYEFRKRRDRCQHGVQDSGADEDLMELHAIERFAERCLKNVPRDKNGKRTD